MGPFDVGVVNLALPRLGLDLGADITMLAWVVTGYALALTVLLVHFGRLADSHGRRRIFSLGVTVFTVASVGCGLSPSIVGLISFRIMQGIGAAMMSGNSIALLTAVYPSEERGKALGINTTAVYMGLAAGPTLGGFLVGSFGWRSIFFVNAPIGAIVSLLALFKIKAEPKEAAKEPFDPFGGSLFAASLTVIILGLLSLQTRSSFLTGELLLACGLVLLVSFVLVEKRVKSPFIDPRLFSNNSSFAFSNITALLNYMAWFGSVFVISLYLQIVLKYSPELAGMVLLILPLFMVSFSSFAGWITDRVEPRIVASGGIMLSTAGIIALSALATESSIADVAWRLALVGLGWAFFSSPNTYAVMSSVNRSQYGLAAGVLGTMRFTGQATGLALAAAILSSLVGPTSMGSISQISVSTDLLTMGVQGVLKVAAAISIIGVLTSLVRGKVHT